MRLLGPSENPAPKLLTAGRERIPAKGRNMKVAEKKLIDKAFSDVEQMIDSLTRIKDDWEDSYSGKSDKWQESR
jgi:hypothetical protein